jgi:hypothetical protein
MADKEQDKANQELEKVSLSDSDMNMGDDGNDHDNEGGEKLKVVFNYQPCAVSTKEITGDASQTHIINPISGKSVPIADMPEHMRIQLLDPKWAKERNWFLEKQRETNFVARGNIYGSSNQKDDSEKRLTEENCLIR